MYIDEDEEFKKSLGGGAYRNWWLLKPSVLAKMFSYASRFGTGTNDVTDKKTQLLGGTMIIKNGEVIFTHKETSTFDNGDAKEMLAAVLGKSVSDLDLAKTTPAQYDAVCTRETAEACK